MAFQKDFWFGSASSSYQVEGAAAEDGRTQSTWDVFCREPGRIADGTNADVSCDHYHRYKEDVALMAELGIEVYRFSIAWPRIFPAQGQYNPEGMAFYKNLLSELKRNGIKASVTLYHWDLPMWAYEQGGWTVRACADWFVEYAMTCFRELDGLVDQWVTHNEPWCSSFLSYAIGEQAPGKIDYQQAAEVAHYVLLSHGLAVSAYRAMGGAKPIGIVLNLTPCYAPDDSFLNVLAASNNDGFINRWFLEPLFHGSYPFDMANLYMKNGVEMSFVQPGDLALIGERIDFLGVNYYNRSLLRFDAQSPLFCTAAPSDYKKTDMGWDVSPDEFVDLIRMIRVRYTDLPIYITENGSAWQDQIVDERVHDEDRIDYLVRHLQAVETMNAEGLNVAGYFYWSFMDNFEWSFGFSKRFGLVYCDYATLKRIKKDSFFVYQRIIRERRI